MPSPADLNLPVEFGNAGNVNTEGTGWFVGYSDWAKEGGELRFMPWQARAHGLCVKWFDHEPGYPNGDSKPVSTGRTVSVLVTESGEFRIDFCADALFAPERTASVVLSKAGDFAIWGPGVYHRAFGIRRSVILSVRWELEDCEAAAPAERKSSNVLRNASS